jgi:hypothetical protein
LTKEKIGCLQQAEIPYWRKTQKIFDCLKVPEELAKIQAQ